MLIKLTRISTKCSGIEVTKSSLGLPQVHVRTLVMPNIRVVPNNIIADDCISMKLSVLLNNFLNF